LCHAHIGWMFRPAPTNLDRYVRDLAADGIVRTVSRTFPIWAVAGLIIPAAIGAWWTGTWNGALHGLLWGGLVRIFLVHHATWSINSVCHLWGRRPFRCSDESRNNAICGILALGEGWHNNHHAFPTSARHGLRWWEFDASYLVIRVLEWLGLAWQVRVPTLEATAAKRA
jgi:stearoyl-CoA desaturase (delta-9 desaturase)